MSFLSLDLPVLTLKEVDGVFAFRVFHKEWPSSIDTGEKVEEVTWDDNEFTFLEPSRMNIQ